MLLNEIRDEQGFIKYTTKKQIAHWFDRMIYSPPEYFINDDLSVDMEGNLNIPKKCQKIPFKMNSLRGNFVTTDDAAFASMVNMPKRIYGSVFINDCKLTNLDGMPELISGSLYMDQNKIKSLHNIHVHLKEVNSFNLLTSYQFTCDEATNMLGLFFIKGLKKIFIKSTNQTKWLNIEYIINDHLKNGDVHSCQEQLLENGYTEQAKL